MPADNLLNDTRTQNMMTCEKIFVFSQRPARGNTAENALRPGSLYLVKKTRFNAAQRLSRQICRQISQFFHLKQRLLDNLSSFIRPR